MRLSSSTVGAAVREAHLVGEGDEVGELVEGEGRDGHHLGSVERAALVEQGGLGDLEGVVGNAGHGRSGYRRRIGGEEGAGEGGEEGAGEGGEEGWDWRAGSDAKNRQIASVASIAGLGGSRVRSIRRPPGQECMPRGMVTSSTRAPVGPGAQVVVVRSSRPAPSVRTVGSAGQPSTRTKSATTSTTGR